MNLSEKSFPIKSCGYFEDYFWKSGIKFTKKNGLSLEKTIIYLIAEVYPCHRKFKQNNIQQTSPIIEFVTRFSSDQIKHSLRKYVAIKQVAGNQTISLRSLFSLNDNSHV